MKLLSILLLVFAFTITGCASRKKCCGKEKCGDKKECCMKDKKCDGATCDKKEVKKCCMADCKGKCDPAQEGSCQKCEEGKCDGATCEIKKSDAAPAAAVTPTAPAKKKNQ